VFSHWGIDISNSEKTDKTMAEIELEVNKKIGSEYASIVESGEELIPAYGPNRTGIRNLGNSCYISSVLQALFSLDDFRRGFQKLPEYESNCHENFFSQFQRVGSALVSGKYSRPIQAEGPEGLVKQSDEQEGISPGLFKSVVSKVNFNIQLRKFEQIREKITKNIHRWDINLAVNNNNSIGSNVLKTVHPILNFQKQYILRFNLFLSVYRTSPGNGNSIFAEKNDRVGWVELKKLPKH
jgi:hypothetical protein